MEVPDPPSSLEHGQETRSGSFEFRTDQKEIVLYTESKKEG